MKKTVVATSVEKAVIESVRAWVDSPEGRKELEVAVRDVQASSRRWLSGRPVSDAIMRRRINI